MKKAYTNPDIEIEWFTVNCVISTSDTLGNDNNTDEGDDGFDF